MAGGGGWVIWSSHEAFFFQPLILQEFFLSFSFIFKKVDVITVIATYKMFLR